MERNFRPWNHDRWVARIIADRTKDEWMGAPLISNSFITPTYVCDQSDMIRQKTLTNNR